MGDNVEFAGENQSLESPILPRIKPVFEAATKFDFSKFSQVDDFGKESLGVIDLNRSDFGRESLFFLRDDLQQDSFEILNLTNIDIGKQSLGITNVKSCNLIQNNIDETKNIHLSKIEEDLELIEKNPFIYSPRVKNSRIYKNDFQVSSQSVDFSRESIGILDFNHIDLGRESLILVPDDPFRESLGILNLNNIDIGKESLGFTKSVNDFIVPTLKLLENNENQNSLKNTLSDDSETNITNKNLPEVLITKISDNSNNTLSVLNVGYPQLPLTSVASSTSSTYLSFNSGSLESTMPSRIFSVSSNIDVMNDAFGSTTEYFKRMKSTLSVVSPKLNSSSLMDDVFSSPQISESENKNLDTEFEEAVFIEAKRLAETIANGSFIEKETDMLDSTQEPEDFADVLIDDEPVKLDTETVFKTIDKLFVSNRQKDITKEDNNLSKQSNNSSGKSEKNSSHNSEKSYSSNSTSKSKEALEIIHSLSEILNSDKPKKEEGQNLLSSLAEIVLCSTSTQSRSCILDDSGHSSIEEEPQLNPEKTEVYEVLDLRKKSASASDLHESENEICAPLDLSMKSKSFASPKVLPPKYNRAPKKATVSLNINCSSISNCSASSNESRSLSDFRKFKPKKNDEKLGVLKKGPMKAVHPVDNMAKDNGTQLKITPTRTEAKSAINKMKKTSTPINDPTLKPMAQSTPENVKISFPTSPLARPSSVSNSSKVLKKKIDSKPKTQINKSSNTKIGVNSNLRKSSDELRQKPDSQIRITRSYSMESKPTNPNRSSIVKPAIRRGSFSYTKSDNKAAVLTENKAKITGRPSSLKKPGKENLRK